MACSALIESGLWSETAIERQMSHNLHPKGRVHRGAQADHELVEPVSGGQPAGACHPARICKPDRDERHAAQGEKPLERVGR